MIYRVIVSTVCFGIRLFKKREQFEDDCIFMQAFKGNGFLVMGDVGPGEASGKAVAIGAGGVVGAQPLLLGCVVEPRDQHRVPRRLAEVPPRVRHRPNAPQNRGTVAMHVYSWLKKVG